YTVTVTNSISSVTTQPAQVSVINAASSRLANLSVRTTAGTGAQTLTAGFVIGGTGNKTLLVRGIGPALTGFGVTGALVDPTLGVYGANTTLVASNDNWNASDAATMS